MRADDDPAPAAAPNEVPVSESIPEEGLLPKLVIEPEDILESKTEEVGDRRVTVQRVSPIELTEPVPAIPPDPNSAEVQQRLQELIAKHTETPIVFIGATIFHSAVFSNGSRTLIQVWDKETDTTFKLWSSANFSLLGGIGTFQGGDGRNYALMMSHSETDIDRWGQFMAERGREYTPPVAPNLPAGAATFVVAEGTPSPAEVAPITALHQFYNSKIAALQAAQVARAQERRQRKAALREDPPQPKNIIIRHWRIDEAGQQGVTPKPAVAR